MFDEMYNSFFFEADQLLYGKEGSFIALRILSLYR